MLTSSYNGFASSRPEPMDVLVHDAVEHRVEDSAKYSLAAAIR